MWIRMKIGFYTAALGELEIDKVLEWASQAGFKSLEISAWPESKHLNLRKPSSLEDIRRRAETRGMTVSSLGYYANNLDADRAKRARHISHLKDLMVAAGESAIGIVSTFAGANLQLDFDQNIHEFVEVFGPIADLARQHDVKIAIENCPMLDDRSAPTNIAFSPQNWSIMFKELGASNVGLELDPSHLVWQFIDPVNATSKFSQKVFVVHLKDTEIFRERLNEIGIMGQGWWRYRLPGFGQIDWPKFFKSLADGGFDGCMNIEHEDPVWSGTEEKIKEGLTRSLAYLERRVG